MSNIEQATREVFSLILTPEVMLQFGVVTSRKRKDVAYGDLSDERYPWEVICRTGQGAAALAETFNQESSQNGWGSVCHLRADGERKRCVFNPVHLVRFVEIEKLHHAISTTLHLTEEEKKRLKITVGPAHVSSIPDVNIAIKIGPDSNRIEDADHPQGAALGKKICQLLGETHPEEFWARLAPHYEGDDHGLVWRDRFVNPQKLYKALNLPLPSYMEERPIEERPQISPQQVTYRS